MRLTTCLHGHMIEHNVYNIHEVRVGHRHPTLYDTQTSGGGRTIEVRGNTGGHCLSTIGSDIDWGVWVGRGVVGRGGVGRGRRRGSVVGRQSGSMGGRGEGDIIRIRHWRIT